VKSQLSNPEPDSESADDDSTDLCEPAAKNRKISPFDWFQTVAPDKSSGVKKRTPKHQQSAV